MGKRRGARDLGLDVQWQWEFRGPGSVVHTRIDTVALDLGNRLAPGVIDQHQDASLGPSTADLVYRRGDLVYDHLMQAWLNRADDGQGLTGRSWTPIIVTHRVPDFDGIVAALLTIELVETGQFPRWAESLVKLASAVDQARVRKLGVEDVNPLSIFYAFYALPSYLSDEERALRGMVLIRHEAKALTESVERPLKVSDWLGDQAGAWVSLDAESQHTGEQLRSDRTLYEEELAEGMHQLRRVILPCFEGGMLNLIEVDAMITRVRPGSTAEKASGYSQSRLLKYWVRQSEVPMMISPRLAGGRHHTVTISVDPTWEDALGRKPSLAGLGYALERAEKEAREVAGGDDRLKQPRFDDGTVDNDDPWYDGRGHDHTIVESPRGGTVLSDEQIVDIASGQFWQRPVQARVQVLLVPGAMDTMLKLAEVPQGEGTAEELSDDFSLALKSAWEGLSKRGARVPDWAVPDWSDAPNPPRLEDIRSELIEYAQLERFAVHRLEWRFKGTDAVLVNWMDRLRLRDEPLYLFVELEESPPGLKPEEMVSRLMGLGPDEVRRSEVLVDGIGISARTLVCFADSRHNQSLGRDVVTGRGEQLRSVQLHAAMLHGKLSELRRRLSSGETGTSTTASRALLDEFNAVLFRYDQPEVSENLSLQRSYDVLSERVKLRSIRDQAQHEKQTLEARIEHKHGRNTELILYLIGLMGVIEATNGIQSLLTMEPIHPAETVTWLWLGDILPPWYWIGGGSAAVVLAVVGLWIYHKK